MNESSTTTRRDLGKLMNVSETYSKRVARRRGHAAAGQAVIHTHTYKTICMCQACGLHLKEFPFLSLH